MLRGRANSKSTVWQIDPSLCTSCGQCATECVLDISASKCYHNHEMCGYCRLCTGYFVEEPIELNSGAENLMCPTGALIRTFIEDPYYEYMIDKDLCVGCAKCVKGCEAFGNGSLYMQVDHEACINCNECAIAKKCPAQAFVRVSTDQDQAYIPKTRGGETSDPSDSQNS
jgi:Na+-translocating ferredoxin:NAD+ oxidoreductase subunit B